MQMKPFNLEKAMAGDPVCMRDGRPVKILDFDFDGKILYKYKDKINTGDEKWFMISVDQEGNYDKEYGSHYRDLMMDDKKAYMNVYKREDGILIGGNIYPSEEDLPIEKFMHKCVNSNSPVFFCKAKVILIDK